MASTSENPLNISSTEDLTALENATQNSNSNHASERQPEFRLEFLCSLIPRSFDGKRQEINEFITNCDNANKLATASQKHPLLVYIISKLTGPVRTQLHGKSYSNWSELRQILNNIYLDKKHYVQLMEELNTLRQSNESVTSFHDKIEQLSNRIINSLVIKDQKEEIGKIETIKELALSRFVYHSTPDISRFLRSQNIENLSDALTKAVEEERALKICHSESKRSQVKFCNNCKRNGHLTKDCFKNTSFKSFKPQQVLINQPSSTNNQHQNQKFCRYCRSVGHLIQDCRKREYANKRKGQSQNFSQNTNPSNSTNLVNLNSIPPQVNAEPVEVDVSQA